MESEFNRREFLNTVAVAVAGAATAEAARTGGTPRPPEGSPGEVPDTLDLADRGRIALSALTQVVDPHRKYQPYHQAVFYTNPPFMTHQEGSDEGAWAGNELWGKHVEVILMTRLMSGSDQNRDVDDKTTEGMISCFGDDNLYWKKVFRATGADPREPYQAVKIVPDEDHAPLLAQARVTLALLERYEIDGNPHWLQVAQRSSRGLMSMSIQKDGYAYYPDSNIGGTLCVPRGGWKTRDEPAGWSIDKNYHFSNSCIEFSYGAIVRAMCKLHRVTGDERPLEFAGRLVNFMMKPRMWTPEAEPKAVVSADRGHFDGHFHSYCWGFWGLLEYADTVNNARLKSFARDGYEYGRNFGISRAGLFIEGCTVGDMTNLAIRLSEMGVGDYWEEVDRYVRNHLAEIQLLRPELVEKICEQSKPHQTRDIDSSENTIQRNLGALFADATHLTTATPGGIYCCTQNGLGAYYRAWKAIVAPRGRGAQVNLLLNRTSPWLDIDSYLPYEGKVVIHNKTAETVSVRIPEWVNPGAVETAINGNPVSPFWTGRYMVLSGTGPNETITITFPVVEATETYQNGFQGVGMPGHTEVTSEIGKRLDKLTPYTFRLRGNTIVEISPRDGALGYPIYLRDNLKAARAPMKARSGYVVTKFV
jgi:hypothetical protein